MKNWNEMTDQEQIYAYWEYSSNLPEGEEISFSEFDSMMREIFPE